MPYNYFFACFVKKFYEVESIRYYEQEADFKVAVDCIIFGFDEEGLKLLLLKRNFEPCKGEWSLMGESGPGSGTGIEGLYRLGKSLYGAIDDIQ